MKLLRTTLMLLAMMTTFAAGCRRNDPIEPMYPYEPMPPIVGAFTMSGVVVQRKPIVIPDNARLLVVWSVSATSPDYGYIYGEGTIDRQSNTFSLTFDRELPVTGMNLYPDGVNGFGVGYVILTSDESLRQGDIVSDDRVLERSFLGTIDNTCLIYVSGDPDAVYGDYCSTCWLRPFSEGYNVGRGTDLDCRFDGFTPVRSDYLILQLDTDMESFEFPNWS